MKYNSDTEQLLNSIMQLKNLASQSAHQTHEEKVATMLQFSGLNFLKQQPDATVGDLAQFLGLSKSSATQLVERLVKLGLVKRADDKQDRRVVHLNVTAKGEEERISLRKKILKRMNSLLSKLPEEDVKELIRIHINLVEILKKEPA